MGATPGHPGRGSACLGGVMFAQGRSVRLARSSWAVASLRRERSSFRGFVGIDVRRRTRPRIPKPTRESQGPPKESRASCHTNPVADGSATFAWPPSGRRRYTHDMDHFTNPRVTRWTLVTSVVIVAALTLSACTTSVTFSPLGTGEARVVVETSGGLLVIHVPASRPESGIEVQREDGRTFRIPPGHYPPPGECRIWIPDVAPGQQGPPGACEDLERQVPSGAYLVYG